MARMSQKLAFGAFMGWNFELSQGDLERCEGGAWEAERSYKHRSELKWEWKNPSNVVKRNNFAHSQTWRSQGFTCNFPLVVFALHDFRKQGKLTILFFHLSVEDGGRGMGGMLGCSNSYMAPGWHIVTFGSFTTPRWCLSLHALYLFLELWIISHRWLVSRS